MKKEVNQETLKMKKTETNIHKKTHVQKNTQTNTRADIHKGT